MKEVKILFDNQYKTYGKNLPQIWLYPNLIENFYLRNIINSIKPKLILDAGCGVGLKLENLRNYNVIGFDYSFEAVKICKNDKFKVVQASVHQIPFKNEIFDFVFSFQVIQHLPNWDYISLSFKEISRVLKKGGYFLTINYRLGGRLKERYMPIKEDDKTLHRWAFDFKDYENLAKENHLEIIKIGTILNLKPKGIGKFPFLNKFYQFADYQMFKFGYKRGLYLVGLFRKI